MDIFELAHKQLMTEIDSGKRPLQAIEVNGKIYPYSFDTLILHAIKIRKWIDGHTKKGSIEQAVDRVLTGNKAYRHNRYLEKGV